MLLRKIASLAPASLLRRPLSSIPTSLSKPRDRIRLRGLIFFAHHGVHPEEQRLGQKFRLDISIHADLREIDDNNLEGTIDYAQVYATVRDIVTKGKRRRLVESVAEDVARGILGTFEKAREVEVGVMKPQVAVEGVVEGLGVEIRRSRRDFGLKERTEEVIGSE